MRASRTPVTGRREDWGLAVEVFGEPACASALGLHGCPGFGGSSSTSAQRLDAGCGPQTDQTSLQCLAADVASGSHGSSGTSGVACSMPSLPHEPGGTAAERFFLQPAGTPSELWHELASAAESGWDFSSRWCCPLVLPAGACSSSSSSHSGPLPLPLLQPDATCRPQRRMALQEEHNRAAEGAHDCCSASAGPNGNGGDAVPPGAAPHSPQHAPAADLSAPLLGRTRVTQVLHGLAGGWRGSHFRGAVAGHTVGHCRWSSLSWTYCLVAGGLVASCVLRTRMHAHLCNSWCHPLAAWSDTSVEQIRTHKHCSPPPPNLAYIRPLEGAGAPSGFECFSWNACC
jgi:hypothetical protein